MEIYIKCEGTTNVGLTFGQVIVGLLDRKISISQATDLISDLEPHIDAYTIMYLLLECDLLEFGADWIRIKPQKKNYVSTEIRSLPVASSLKQSTRSPGWVYLVKAEGLEQYKIGRSRTPEIRLKTLQQQSPISLTLTHLIKCTDMGATELYLHRRFSQCRVGGEWFALTPESVQWIISQDSLEGVL